MTEPASDPPEEVDALTTLTGPFYGHGDVLRMLNIDDATASARVTAHTLLAPRAADGTPLYPAWQFQSGGRIVPHLAEVLELLAGGIDDPWTWAAWLCAPDDDLEGLTSAQWLASGRDPEPVLLEAARDAANWRS